MGLKNMSLIATPTSITAAGGTALVFAEDGVTIANGLHLFATSDTDYTTRRVVTIKNRPATLDAKTGSWSKDKKSMSLAKPVVLADGRTVFCTLRLEREAHPSLSAADALELNNLGAQLLTDPDVASFWANGNMS